MPCCAVALCLASLLIGGVGVLVLWTTITGRISRADIAALIAMTVPQPPPPPPPSPPWAWPQPLVPPSQPLLSPWPQPLTPPSQSLLSPDAPPPLPTPTSPAHACAFASIIRLRETSQEGLGDRAFVLAGIGNLATWLCARAHVDRPAVLLHPSHNGGQSVN
eukprot:4929681-Prymnesium_polylepis.1